MSEPYISSPQLAPLFQSKGAGTDKAALTAKQRAIYEFIKHKILSRRYGPTVREIGAGFKIKSPNGVMCHLKALEKKGLINRESGMSRAIQLTEPLHPTALPLKGVICAGKPWEGVEDNEQIDFSHLFEGEGQFCLRVRGQSMIEAHIDEGDYVVVRKQRIAKDGEIVVALLNGEEATLKRFFREPTRIRLEPANSAMSPIYSAHVDVLGVVTGVIRKYS